MNLHKRPCAEQTFIGATNSLHTQKVAQQGRLPIPADKLVDIKFLNVSVYP